MIASTLLSANRSKMKTNLSVRSMAFTALMAALICVTAPFVIPIGAVPLSLATLAVYLSGTLLGCKRGTISVLIYLLIGAVGIPVYSGFTAGLGQLLGVTGGFLMGYIPCALLTGLLCDIFQGRLPGIILGMFAGTLSCYLLGTVWYILLTGIDIGAALVICVVPFIPGDILKISTVCAIAVPLKKRLSALENRHPKQ